jgi:hypothetical protein
MLLGLGLEFLVHGLLIALMMEAASTSETSVNYLLHYAKTQKTAIFKGMYAQYHLLMCQVILSSSH